MVGAGQRRTEVSESVGHYNADSTLPLCAMSRSPSAPSSISGRVSATTPSSSEQEISPLLVKYLEPGDDELIRKSMEIILLEQKASTSYLQRRLKIGYNRAAEIMDKFEQRGLVSPPLPGGSKRDILVTVGIAND
jgi:DNA segregation ATPase FtsK/SpoIIIE-like protein